MQISRITQFLLLCMLCASSLFAMEVVHQTTVAEEKTNSESKSAAVDVKREKKKKADSTNDSLCTLLKYYMQKHHVSPGEIDKGLVTIYAESSRLRVMCMLIQRLLQFVDLPKLCRIIKHHKINLNFVRVRKCPALYSLCSTLGYAGVILMLLAGANVKELCLFSDAVRWGDRLSALCLLIGGVNPNAYLNHDKTGSMLNCATYNLCQEKVIQNAEALADHLAIVCMLLTAGADLTGLTWDMGLKDSITITCCALKVLIGRWAQGTCEERASFIQAVLMSADKADKDKSAQYAKDIILSCRLLEYAKKGNDAVKRACLLNLYDLAMDKNNS